MTGIAVLFFTVLLWALFAWLLEKPAFVYTLVALMTGAGLWLWHIWS